MKKALVYMMAFLAIQIVAGSIAKLVWQTVMGQEGEMSSTAQIIMQVLVNLQLIVLFLYARWVEVSRHWVRTRPWTVLCWCALAAMGAIIPSEFLQEQLPELPNWVESDMEQILANRWGYLAIGLMAPLAEELVFRGAILRALLRWNRHPWVGILISALIFAACHVNPAQFPHAFLIGLLLGWMYYRTDSIVPGVVYHWVNNTVAYVLYNLYPSSDIELIDLFGGNQRTVLMAVGFSLCILAPALYQLNLLMKKN